LPIDDLRLPNGRQFDRKSEIEDRKSTEIALLDILAQDSPPPQGGSQLLFFLPLILLVVVYFVLLVLPKRKQEKERQSMLSNLKKGDRVQSIGGILGTVVSTDETEVLVKVDETTNTKMRFTRNAIHRVIVDEKKADSK
jgi:preprotein translocase subunit YajC